MGGEAITSVALGYFSLSGSSSAKVAKNEEMLEIHVDDDPPLPALSAAIRRGLIET